MRPTFFVFTIDIFAKCGRIHENIAKDNAQTKQCGSP